MRMVAPWQSRPRDGADLQVNHPVDQDDSRHAMEQCRDSARGRSISHPHIHLQPSNPNPPFRPHHHTYPAATSTPGVRLPPQRPPGGMLGYCTRAQEVISPKRQKNTGSSVAEQTTGAFLSMPVDRTPTRDWQARGGTSMTAAGRVLVDLGCRMLCKQMNPGTPSPQATSPKRTEAEGSNNNTKEPPPRRHPAHDRDM